jgi:hypothetical protein
VKKLPKINFKKKYFQGKTSSRKKIRGKLPNISNIVPFFADFQIKTKGAGNVSMKAKRAINSYFVSTYPGEFKELFALRALFFLSHTSSFTDCLTSLSKGLLSPIAINPLFSNHLFVKFPQKLP